MFKKSQRVKVKLTGEEAMILSSVEDQGYIVRLPNYAEVLLRDFEIEAINE